LSLLCLDNVVEVPLIVLFAFTTLLLFRLAFLLFGDDPGLQKLVTQVFHRLPPQ
jgi:hypothetical protein